MYTLPAVCITLLFFLSAIYKVRDFSTVASGFTSRTHLPLSLAKVIICTVILLEIVAPIIITLYSYNSSPALHTYAMYSLLALVAFTALATLLYHTPPTGANYYSFMSNLSTVGGLLLLYQVSK